MDRGAWRATVHGVSKELARTEQLVLSLHAECYSQKAVAGFSGFFVLS